MNHLPKSLKEKKEKERHHDPAIEIPDRMRINNTK